MTIAGERLGAVQVNGHRAIDAIYALLAAEVANAVLRRATPDKAGVARLTLLARSLILNDVGRLLDTARVTLLRAIMPVVEAAEKAAMVGVEPLPRDLGATMLASAETFDTLGTDRRSVLGQTGAILLRGVVVKAAASVVAKQVRQYFSPYYAPRRDATGKLVRDDRHGSILSWPGRAGMASQHARGVMLWQTTSAHSRVMQKLAERDGELLKYSVSPQHSKPDECTSLARANTGFGPGVYETRNAPRVPQHFRCRCHYETVSRPFTEAEIRRRT